MNQEGDARARNNNAMNGRRAPLWSLVLLALGGGTTFLGLAILVVSIVGFAWAGSSGRWLSLAVVMLGCAISAPSVTSSLNFDSLRARRFNQALALLLTLGISIFAFGRAGVVTDQWRWASYAILSVWAVLFASDIAIRIREENRKEEGLAQAKMTLESSLERGSELAADRAQMMEELRQLEREISERNITLKELSSAVEQYRQRAENQENESNRILASLESIRGQLAETERRGMMSQWAFFAMGAVVSIPVGILVNRLS